MGHNSSRSGPGRLSRPSAGNFKLVVYLRQSVRLGVPSALAVYLLLMLSVGCDDSDPSCPSYGIGAVQGHVLSGGTGLSIEVGARALDGLNSGEVIVKTVSDSTGWYRLDLPIGPYRIELKPISATVWSNNMQDTLTIRRRLHTYDLRRGHAEVTVDMPPELEGRRLTLTLDGGTFDWYRSEIDVENGLACFDFEMPRPGQYVMELTGFGSYEDLYLPGTAEPDAATVLNVVDDQVTTYSASFITSYASISGSVTGSWQQAQVTGPDIEIFNDDATRIGRARCADDGSFQCHFPVPKQVRLRVDIDGVVQWLGGDSFDTARVFDLQSGDRVTDAVLVECGLEVSLSGPGALTYHRPTAIVWDDAGVSYSPDLYSENPFHVCNLRPGRYFLHVSGTCDGQTWAAQWYDGTESADEAQAIELLPGQLRQITMELVQGGGLAGTVFMPDGEPVTGYVRCAVFDRNGGPLCTDYDQWQTAVHGEVRFRGPGRRRLLPGTRRRRRESLVVSGDLGFR